MSGQVLIVDDVAQNRLLAEAQLASAGYEVTLAESGPAAIELLEKQPFDLVLLDIMMPGMDGIEACRRIRKLPGCAGLPVVFLTASDGAEVHEQAIESGGDDFLRKPIQRTELLLRVRSLIRINRLQRQKDLLTDLLVHDLKGPLSSIITNTEFAYETTESDEVKGALQDVNAAAEAMHHMVLNLLDIGRAEDGALIPQFEDVDLVALLLQIETYSRRRAALRRQRLVLDFGEAARVIRADRALLSRLLQNLVDNALRYAPKGGAIEIDVTAAPNTFQIRVRDEGPGIPPDARERVFQKYAQLEMRSERSSRGLGLVFCRLAAEAQNGKIWVEDNVPHGAAFVVELPNHRESTR